MLRPKALQAAYTSPLAITFMKKEFTVLLLLLFLFTEVCVGQSVAEFKKLPQPDSLSNRDFKRLAPFFGDKRVVIVGEASHGGREFFTVKTALFRYLVEEQGFIHFVLEENLAVCDKFNAFIAGDLQTDARSLAKEAYYTWPYHTEEFSQLLEWMKGYNETRPSDEKIKFWGVDIQFAYQSLQFLGEKLNKITNSSKLVIAEIPRQEHFTHRVDDSMLSHITNMVNRLESNYPDKANLERHLAAVKMKNIYSNKQRDGLHPTEASSRYRDSCMADNLLRIYNGVGTKEKLMVWAHNAHAAKSFNTAYFKAPMGAFLRELIPNEVRVIGFDYSQGELLMHVPNQGFIPVSIKSRDHHYLARLLDNEKYELMFIAGSELNKPLFSRTLYMRREHLMVEGTYGELYDAIFFVNRVHATTPLK